MLIRPVNEPSLKSCCKKLVGILVRKFTNSLSPFNPAVLRVTFTLTEFVCLYKSCKTQVLNSTFKWSFIDPTAVNIEYLSHSFGVLNASRFSLLLMYQCNFKKFFELPHELFEVNPVTKYVGIPSANLIEHYLRRLHAFEKKGTWGIVLCYIRSIGKYGYCKLRFY